MNFIYRGAPPASKSMLNRLLLLQSYCPGITIRGDSSAEDVRKMRSALASLLRGEAADCGAAGTTFRFLALRASRIPGRHLLTGTAGLFARPQEELLHLLRQLGCHANIEAQSLAIESRGWELPASPLLVGRNISSQFLSALVLNAWALERSLEVRLTGEAVSEGYFAMTLSLVRAAGLAVQITGDLLRVRAHGVPLPLTMDAEPDLSSAFALAAVCLARKGVAEFTDWPHLSLQPDARFCSLLAEMGAQVHHDTEARTLRLSAPRPLQALRADLRDSPDLFPVLSVLCAIAEGHSVLAGAPHLAHKESSRIETTAALLRGLGARFSALADGMHIHGSPYFSAEPFSYRPADDHRLAMAAAVAKAAGARIQIETPEVVDKSFPEFWAQAQVEP